MDNLLQQILDNSILIQIGQKVLVVINERVSRGEFLPGSTSLGYSVKDAPMPLAALIAKIGDTKARAVYRGLKIARGEKPIIWKNAKSGKTWITLTGGYKKLRELTGRETGVVELNWSGHMMSALKAKSDPSVPSVTFYFTDAEASRIAAFHHMGAGRNRIKRLFMGLTDKETGDIEAWLGEQIRAKFKFDLPDSK